MYQFTVKDTEIKSYPLCLGNILKVFTLNKIKKGLKGSWKVFSVDYNTINSSNSLDIHRYLMKKLLN